MVANLRIVLAVIILTALVYGRPYRQQQQQDQCIDNHIWFMDGSVECRFIEVESLYGFHADPKQWCAYSLTDCCDTCKRIQKRFESVEIQNAMINANGQAVVQVQLDSQQINNEPQQMNNEPQQMK